MIFSKSNQNQANIEGDIAEREVYMKIVGVGGAGNNAVDRLQLEPEPKLRLAAINTDAQSLSSSPIAEKIMIGRQITRGLSAGGEASIGQEAAEVDKEAIAKVTNGMDIVFLLAGLGGGTGSGAAPIVAKTAAEQGALVIAFVTLPFGLEGAQRKHQADVALDALRSECDAVIPLPNDVLLEHLPENATVLDAFSQADDWIIRGVRSISSMLLKTGLINLDFATLKKAFVNKGGKTLFGLGRGTGDSYVEEAINDLEICPLLHTPEYAKKADSILVNIIGGTDLSINDINAVMAQLTDKFGSTESTILGAVIDDRLKQHLDICVVGTTEVASKHFPGKSTKALASVQAKHAANKKEQSRQRTLDELEVKTASAEKFAERRVHESKLGKKRVSEDLDLQEEFIFITEDERRGYFENTDANIFEGEDLDVPTFLRRGIKVHT